MTSTSNPDINDNVASIKTQLESVLAQSFLDDSLLLGLLSFINSKFTTWILKDFNDIIRYKKELVQTKRSENAQSTFNTVELLEKAWTNFHYPAIKYFQQSFNELNKGKSKPVEMRKINVVYSKFTKSAYKFYNDLLKNFLANYDNHLLPRKLLFSLGVELNEKLITLDDECQANIVYLAHKCLLCLGDLSRHTSFINNTYLTNLTNDSKNRSQRIKKDKYEVSTKYYENCILILPSLNEPFNHLGMINHLTNCKFDSIYYFMRSALTRINSKLSVDNLNQILSKNETLYNDFAEFTKKHKLDYKRSKMNNKVSSIDKKNQLSRYLFVLLFMSLYSDTKNHSFINATLQHDFLLLSKDIAKDVLTKQVVMLIGGFELLLQKEKITTIVNYNRLPPQLLVYVRFMFLFFNNIFKNNLDLSVVRIILNAIKENKILLNFFHRDYATNEALSEFLNELISTKKDYFDEEELVEISAMKRPKRNYFFHEDVLLKDFTPINFQLKDFNDDDLFSSTNAIDLLNGDASTKLSKVNEDLLRLAAILVLSIKLVDKNTVGLQFVKDEWIFELIDSIEIVKVVEVPVTDERKQRRLKRDKRKNVPETSMAVAKPAKPVIDDAGTSMSLEEIENSILKVHHGQNLESMVDLLTSEEHSADDVLEQPPNSSPVNFVASSSPPSQPVEQVAETQQILSTQTIPDSQSIKSSQPISSGEHIHSNASLPVQQVKYTPSQRSRFSQQSIESHQPIVSESSIASRLRSSQQSYNQSQFPQYGPPGYMSPFNSPYAHNSYQFQPFNPIPVSSSPIPIHYSASPSPQWNLQNVWNGSSPNNDQLGSYSLPIPVYGGPVFLQSSQTNDDSKN